MNYGTDRSSRASRRTASSRGATDLPDLASVGLPLSDASLQRRWELIAQGSRA